MVQSTISDSANPKQRSLRGQSEDGSEHDIRLHGCLDCCFCEAHAQGRGCFETKSYSVLASKWVALSIHIHLREHGEFGLNCHNCSLSSLHMNTLKANQVLQWNSILTGT